MKETPTQNQRGNSELNSELKPFETKYLCKPYITNYGRITEMSVCELAKFLAKHIDHYRAPKEVNEIFENAIDKAGRGVPWVRAFEIWLEREVSTDERAD